MLKSIIDLIWSSYNHIIISKFMCSGVDRHSFCCIKTSGLKKNIVFYYGKFCNIYSKICIIEVYLLKYYFESHLIYKWRYYRQTIFNQLNIMVPYLDIIGLCHSVAILWEIYAMRPKEHLLWLRFHFKRMLITGLGQ